jgi:hypothetical protein
MPELDVRKKGDVKNTSLKLRGVDNGDGTASLETSDNPANAATDLTTMQNAATGTGDGTALTVTGHGASMIQITGTFVGTVTFEVSGDGTNYEGIYGENTETGTRSLTATAPGIFIFEVAACQTIRARVSAYTSGSITAKGRAIPAAVPSGNVTISGSSLTGATAMETQGNVAHDGVNVGNPVGIGGYASATEPMLVATGDRVNLWLNRNGTLNAVLRDSASNLIATAGTGQLVTTLKTSLGQEPLASVTGDAHSGAQILGVGSWGYTGSSQWDRVRMANVFKTGAFASGATPGTVWTPAAGKKFRLLGAIVMVNSTSVQSLELKDGAGGTTIAHLYVMGHGPILLDWGQGKLSSTANNVLEVVYPAIECRILAWGTEE